MSPRMAVRHCVSSGLCRLAVRATAEGGHLLDHRRAWPGAYRSIGPAAAARHVVGRGTSAASSGSRGSAPGTMPRAASVKFVSRFEAKVSRKDGPCFCARAEKLSSPARGFELRCDEPETLAAPLHEGAFRQRVIQPRTENYSPGTTGRSAGAEENPNIAACSKR